MNPHGITQAIILMPISHAESSQIKFQLVLFSNKLKGNYDLVFCQCPAVQLYIPLDNLYLDFKVIYCTPSWAKHSFIQI